MFDIGWSELLIIGVVALVVIGPKDLPKALSTLGKWVARAKSMAREFQNNVDDMVRQAELDELRKQVQQARNFNLSEELEKNIDPQGTVRDSLKVEDFTTPAAAPAPTDAVKADAVTPAPDGATPAAAVAEPAPLTPDIAATPTGLPIGDAPPVTPVAPAPAVTPSPAAAPKPSTEPTKE